MTVRRSRPVCSTRRRRSLPLVAAVFGTRPQLVKLSVVWPVLEQRFRVRLVDSGQHYDFELAESIYRGESIRRPDAHLGVKSGSPVSQIARVAETLDGLLKKWVPDAVLTFGDTSTTTGATLAAAYRGIPTAHIEAGLRSFDTTTPEEKNRIVADHLSTWRFCPTRTAMSNLEREGISDGVYGVGDVMYESFLKGGGAVDTASILDSYGLRRGDFYLVTCHRAENVDTPDQLRKLIDILSILDRPVVFAVHPRTRKNLVRHRLWMHLKRLPRLHLTPPLVYRTTLVLAGSARAVLTDSGGLQREAFWSGTRCLVLRERTEWIELVQCGAGRLVGLNRSLVQRVLRRQEPVRPVSDRVFRSRRPVQRIVSRLAKDLLDR